MAFTTPVYIDEHNVLVRALEPIKKSDIEKLLKWGINEIYLDGEPIDNGISKTTTIFTDDTKLNTEEIQISKEYQKVYKYQKEFNTRMMEIAEKLRNNFKNLIQKQIFNNHEILTESLYIANQIIDFRFFPLLLQDFRVSDDLIVNHSIHAACYAGFLGKMINLSKVRIQDLVFSVMLMDVGMYYIPFEIRKKNSPLTDEEKKVFYKHTLYGYKILTEVAFVKQQLAAVAMQHHENFDGSGYPKWLKDQEISLMARIAAIVDRYTAMLEDRYYRKAKNPYEALKTLLSQESHHLDPRILRFFVGSLSIFPVGIYVLLSDHSKAQVIEGKIETPLRPLIRIIKDPEDNFLKEFKFLDLSKNNNLTITKVLHKDEFLKEKEK